MYFKNAVVMGRYHSIPKTILLGGSQGGLYDRVVVVEVVEFVMYAKNISSVLLGPAGRISEEKEVLCSHLWITK